MKKPLTYSTINKILIKRGWKISGNGYVYLGASAGTNVFLDLPGLNSVKCHGGRWKKAGNVHIESYWAWPRSIAEWNKTLDDIEAVYTELCGTHFQKFSFEPKMWFKPLWPKSKKTKRRS